MICSKVSTQLIQIRLNMQLTTSAATAEQKRKVRFFEVSIPDISSKEIRERLKNGLPCAEISPAVAAYMKREKLYT